MLDFTVRQSSVVRVWKALNDTRTEFARVYVMVNVHGLDLLSQTGVGGERRRPLIVPHVN